MTQKSVPYSLEAEEALLGNILLYSDVMRQCVDAEIYVDDFYYEKHQTIYSVMRSMFENGEKVGGGHIQ